MVPRNSMDIFALTFPPKVVTRKTKHPLGRFSKKAGFLDNGEGVLNTPSDASMQPSRQNLSKAAICVVYAP